MYQRITYRCPLFHLPSSDNTFSQAMASRLSSSFRLVDFFRLGGAMPEEVVNGHGSQMLNLWVAWLIFSANGCEWCE